MCLTIWWRTIELTNTTRANIPLGTYLEDRYLKGLGGPYGQAEWHVVVGWDGFEKLCDKLDSHTKDKRTDRWWTNIFDNKTALEKFSMKI